ncbi:MAG TPA: membrane protein insertion efficiency factor YidD [Porticoccaceae bacterium]|jgi:putative membrane protein insertion efficiency factor|nr:membrane protein insertion efficiency factor YidD [Porticoccaceae bacterium]
MRNLFLKCIRGYQLAISPLLGNNCRFHPSCSCFTHEAITRFGVLKGSYLSCLRILKCNPFSAGGYDPVPEIKSSDDSLIKNQKSSK